MTMPTHLGYGLTKKIMKVKRLVREKVKRSLTQSLKVQEVAVLVEENIVQH